MSFRLKARPSSPATEAELGPARSRVEPNEDPAKPLLGQRWIPWVFAAKTEVDPDRGTAGAVS